MSRAARPERRSERRRERLKRRVRRVVVALGAALIAVTTLLYFFPLQSEWLERRAERELSAALGRPVSIGAIFVFVFQSRVEIHDVALASVAPVNPPPPYLIKKAVLHVSVLSLPWRGPRSVTLIEVHEPGDLSAEFDSSHTFRAGGVPGEMLEALLARRRATPSGRGGPPRLPVNVAIYRARLTLDVAPSPISSFSVRLNEGALRGNERGDLSTFMSGYTAYGNALTPYRAELAYRAADEAVEGRITLPGGETLELESQDKPGLVIPPLHATDLSVGLRRQGAAGARLFDLEMAAAACRVNWPGRARPFEDGPIHARARFIPPERRGGPLVIDPFAWQSQFGDFEGRFALQPDAPSTWTLALMLARPGPAARREAIALAGQRFGAQFDDTHTSASFTLAAAGSMASGINRYNGRWAVANLGLAHASLPEPVVIKRINGSFSEKGLDIHALAVEAFRTEIDGRGQLDAPDFTPRRLRFEWNTLTGLREAGAILATLAPKTPPLTLAGKVRTSGWMELPLPFGANPAGTADFDVTIAPENATFEWPERALRGTIIGGEAHVRPALLEFRDIRLRQFDSLFHLRGTIAGEQLFWRNPQASLGIEGTLPLDDFFALAAPRRAGQTPFVSAFGQMGLKAEITGRLDLPGGLYWQAEGDLRQTTISFPALPALESITRLEGNWFFNGDMVQVRSLRGQWGPIPFAAQGRFAPRLIALQATSELNLEDFAGQIPPLKRDYILYGPVTAQGDISIVIPEELFTAAATANADTPSTISFATTKPALAAIPAETRAQTQRIVEDIRTSMRHVLALANAEVRRPLPILQNDAIDLRGTLRVKDGAFGHVTMPALISRIDAAMTWENHRLSWDGGTGMAGRSAVVTGPCSIDLAGEYPKMTFAGRMEDFDLNQWIGDWPDADPPTTATLARRDKLSTQTLFSIDLDAEARRVHIYKYTLGDFSGVMHYEKWRHAPSHLTFDAKSADAFGGRGHSAGRLEFRRGEKPWFDFVVSVERSALDQYFAQISPRHAGIRGSISGTCAVRGRPKDSLNLRGEGRFVIQNSEFMRFPVFEGLAELTGVDSFRQASFSSIEGEFELRDGRVNFSRISCDNPLVKIHATGWVDYKMNIAFEITLSYFRSAGGTVPFIGGVMKGLDALISMTAKIRVTGTLEEPVVTLSIL